MTAPQQPAGWFPDPLGRYDHRWFNGAAWTADVAADGTRLVDPFGTGPGPSTPAGNRPATIALVCGLIGMAVAWIPFVVAAGIVLGVVAVVAGVRGLRRARVGGVGRGRAVAGIVTGALTCVLSILGIVLTVVVFREVIDFVEPGPRFVDAVECSVDGRDVTVTGTLENLDDEVRGYTVFAEVDRATGYSVIDSVTPSEVVEWRVDLRTTDPLEVCDPDVVVNGPFPFGIETDPYRE